MLSFSDSLKNQPILILDGGMGTSLYDKGIFINQSFDSINLSNPSLVREIHEDFAEAGSDILTTNSFGANHIKLSPHGLEEKVYDINKVSVEIARSVAGRQLYVAGCIGPLGKKVRPFGPVAEELAFEYFKEQIKGLIDGGVDLFILETFTYLNELEIALKAVQELSDKPILSLVTVKEDGTTLIGVEPAGFIPTMESWGVDGVGVNCSVGPHALLTAVEAIMEVATVPVVVQPNAGIPRNVEGRNLYLSSPEYMAEYARRYIELGVKIVGGCCGTRSEHIKAIKNASKMIHPGTAHHHIHVKKREVEILPGVPVEEKSNFAKKIVNNEFVTSVELTPPKGWIADKVIESARVLRENGIDCVNIPDGPRATARMSPQMLSHLMREKSGIDTILHYCCRDRNLLGMQSDILGNYAGGQKNILIITGDPPKMGDYPDATAVFDVDSIGLTKLVSNLNHGIDLGRNPIGKPTGYYIGIGANPNALDQEREIRRFGLKVEAGAEYAITQPVFDIDSMLEFMDNVSQYNIPFLAGIWPLVSVRNAEFMKHEVPGVYLPTEILDRIKKFDKKEDQLKVGIEIASESLQKIKKYIKGAQVSAPFGKIEYALEVLKGI